MKQAMRIQVNKLTNPTSIFNFMRHQNAWFILKKVKVVPCTFVLARAHSIRASSQT